MVEIEQLVKQLMDQHDLVGWVFKWDNAKKRFGRCTHRNKTITLSKHLTPLRKITDTKNTILHEIAHALVGPKHGHDQVWKAKAIEIGCTGDRCSNDVSLAQPYKGTCPNCNKVIFRHRRKGISCGVCDPNYNEKYLFFWEANLKLQLL